jgi:hypothetical protein
MRLIEIKEKVRHTSMPKAVFHEIQDLEVDTLGPESPEGKRHLVDDMQRAIDAGNLFKVPLTRESSEYLLHSALPNLIDIAQDNMDKKLIRALQSLQARIHSRLEAAEA